MSSPVTLTVQAGEHDRISCPVTFELPWDYKETPAVLLKTEDGKEHPAQVSKARGGIRVTWLVNNLKAGASLTLEARPADADAAQPGRSGVSVDDDATAKQVSVNIKGSDFTTYHYGEQWVRPFLFPILGPKGVRVTRSWPVTDDVPGEKQDHPHHKSVWVAYGECDKVDNWSENEGHGWQRHRRFTALQSGPVFGRITAVNDWCHPSGRKQFEEQRDMVFYATPGGDQLFDVAVTFRMTEKQVVFRDTKEGGILSVRVTSSMDVPVGGRIENGYGGINEDETWGKKAPWCDYSGTVDGVQVGVAVMDHEKNPRYPTEWHVRNYGLMTANPFGWSHYRPEDKEKGDMVFPKGSRHTWKYRVYVHRGNASRARAGERFIDFVAPPKVTLG